MSTRSGKNKRRKARGRSSTKSTTKRIQVFNSDGEDVTPLALCHAETRDTQADPGKLFLDDLSSKYAEFTKSTTSSKNPFHSQQSSQSNVATPSIEPEGTSPKLKIPIYLQAIRELQEKDATMDEEVVIYLTATDTISLIDIPSTMVSEDAEDAEAIKQENSHYVELCKNRAGNDKYVVGVAQTFHGAPKSKMVQSDEIVMVDEGTMASPSDIYDSYCEQNESGKTDNPDSDKNTSRGQEKGREERSSTVYSDSRSNTPLGTDELQLIMLSESFRHSLSVMERCVVANIFQNKLAAYRQLPILEDPDGTEKPRRVEQGERGEESSSSPTQELLCAFSCEVTRGSNITCMAWNKKDKDLLAVGYGDPAVQKPGFICCWSIKNITWPDRVYNCHCCVTALDFSAKNPCQLAVGMYDGTVAIYNVGKRNNEAFIANSSECSSRHLHPVWHVNWNQFKGKEAPISVSAAGRIARWFRSSSGLDCEDVMHLKYDQENNFRTAMNNKYKTWSEVPRGSYCLPVAFHPIDSTIFLEGTSEGLIHKRSLYLKRCPRQTYQILSGPVSHIEWSPFSPDMFLSCSHDGIIQLWRQDLSTPILSFTSIQTAVHTVRWSPNWPTVFAAIHSGQLEIWDLKSSILQPTIVHQAAPGVSFTSLLFARGTDCVLVGDSVGEVSVYKLKNLWVGKGKQVDSLEDIIHSAAPV